MDKNIVRNVQIYIENHIYNILDKLALSTISSEFGYSSYYLSRLFKKVVGINIFEYIRKIRLTKSAKVLRDHNELKVIDVAFDFYFDSHEGFTRAFAKEFKINPKSYQKHPTPLNYYIPYLMDINKGEINKTKHKKILFKR